MTRKAAEHEQATDEEVLRDLAHAKATFQLRAIEAIVRCPAKPNDHPDDVEIEARRALAMARRPILSKRKREGEG